MQPSRVHNSANRAFDFIIQWILPAGYFLLLSALFFLPDRSLHHKLYYALFSIPVLTAIFLRPRELKHVLREPLVLLFLTFAGFAILSLAWSDTETSAGSLIKRPLHILMLFIGMGLMLRHRSESIQPVIFISALFALGASGMDLFTFVRNYAAGQRLIGSGAMDNPLLSAHLFGFFCIYWLFVGTTATSRTLLLFSVAAFALMLTTVLATGSRTTLVAIFLGSAWIACMRRNRISLRLFLIAPMAAVVILIVAPDALLGRGLSFRHLIWQYTLDLISARPWLGHGYDAGLKISGYSEPHSFALGVLYYVGIVGFIPWILLIGSGLYYGWQNREKPLFVLASALLMYGIGGGLTEGGGILSRPKEHWFLLWIPLALIAGLNIAQRCRQLPLIQPRRLSAHETRQMAVGASTIEQDGLGPKVMRLTDGSFLKLFRSRRWYTSGRIFPYAERFAINSQRLVGLGFSAPTTLGIYRHDDGSSAVKYAPLPGHTLRQALDSASTKERDMLIEKFGAYLAQLHECGVYFRSIHLGNVLVLKNAELGLIDLADMRILPSPLSLGLRLRNLRHMRRYKLDCTWLFESHLDSFLRGYETRSPAFILKRMHKQINELNNGKE